MRDMEETIRRIHDRCPIVDAHLDLGAYLRQERRKGRHRVIESDYLPDMRQGGVNVVVCAIFVDPKGESGSSLQQACEQIACLYAEMEETPGLFRLCVSYEEILRTIDSGMTAILLSFEGAEPLGPSPELLPLFYRLGVRGIGLAHARRNLACDGAQYTDSPHNLGCGLTDLGVALIREASRLHMLIDLSHLNDAGVADTLGLAAGPVIASHSNCRAINPTRRNMTDEQIRAVAAAGGVIGVNGCSAIIGDGPDNADLSALVRHINHLVQIGGIEHVGLGFDLAERIMPDSVIVVNGYPQRVYDVIPSYAELPRLTRALLEAGYSEADIAAIYGGNFLRVYRAILQ